VKPSILKKEARQAGSKPGAPPVKAAAPLPPPGGVRRRQTGTSKRKLWIVAGLLVIVAGISALTLLQKPKPPARTAEPGTLVAADRSKPQTSAAPPATSSRKEEVITAPAPTAGVAGNPQPPAAAAPPAPALPKLPGTVSFRGHDYLLVHGDVTWEEARLAAEKLGGHLATLTSQEENDWATKTFLKPKSRIWLGARLVLGE
jgi:hypothetical protein